jgi:hypothetical protein
MGESAVAILSILFLEWHDIIGKVHHLEGIGTCYFDFFVRLLEAIPRRLLDGHGFKIYATW